MSGVASRARMLWSASQLNQEISSTTISNPASIGWAQPGSFPGRVVPTGSDAWTSGGDRGELVA